MPPAAPCCLAASPCGDHASMAPFFGLICREHADPITTPRASIHGSNHIENALRHLVVLISGLMALLDLFVHHTTSDFYSGNKRLPANLPSWVLYHLQCSACRFQDPASPTKCATSILIVCPNRPASPTAMRANESSI